MAARIKETELILPSLYLMILNKDKISTTELIQKLREIMNPTGEDLEILSGRSDDKFSQKVRNLNSHKTFERSGYAEYIACAKGGYFKITKEGKKHVKQNKDFLEYLIINDFSYSVLKETLLNVEKKQKNRKIQVFDENVIIQEGTERLSKTTGYERSSKLRNYAINYFSKKGKISCAYCSFNFEDFYGEQLGKGFIEIHHTKPIFKYENEDLNRTLKKAVENLTPVCSNCHRMIHRNWKKPIDFQALIDSINQNGFKKWLINQ